MSPEANVGTDTILELRDLHTHFHTPDGVLKAVDGVTYSLAAGETLGVVGESGCGKSVTALSILRLIPEPPGRIFGGGIFFEGKDLTKMAPKELRKIRGNHISMIFQEPMTSLNPVFTIGFQIAEAIMLHQNMGKKDAMDKSAEMLDERLSRIPEASCTGDLGVQSTCTFNGLFFILSGVGTIGSDHETYIQDQLAVTCAAGGKSN